MGAPTSQTEKRKLFSISSSLPLSHSTYPPSLLPPSRPRGRPHFLPRNWTIGNRLDVGRPWEEEGTPPLSLLCAKWTGRVRGRREGAAEELGAARDKCFSPLSPPYTRRGGKGGFISFFFCLLLFPFSCLLRKKCLFSYPPCVFCKKKNKKPCTDAHDTMDITLTCLSWLASSFSDSICHATNNRKHEAKMKAASFFN